MKRWICAALTLGLFAVASVGCTDQQANRPSRVTSGAGAPKPPAQNTGQMQQQPPAGSPGTSEPAAEPSTDQARPQDAGNDQTQPASPPAETPKKGADAQPEPAPPGAAQDQGSEKSQ